MLKYLPQHKSHQQHSTKKNRYREAKVDVTKSLTHNYLGMMAVTTPSQPGWLFLTCLTPVCRILAGPLSLQERQAVANDLCWRAGSLHT
jgi:hypothetical protein